MYLLNFTKNFTRGILKGIFIPDSISFVDSHRAMEWVDAILQREREGTLDWFISDFTH